MARNSACFAQPSRMSSVNWLYARFRLACAGSQRRAHPLCLCRPAHLTCRCHARDLAMYQLERLQEHRRRHSAQGLP